jgi:uncharacterized protein YkwD
MLKPTFTVVTVALLLNVGLTISVAIVENSTLTEVDKTALRIDELNRHNQLRALHQNTGKLTLNDTLNTAAQIFADYLFKNGDFQHSQQAMTGSYG